MDSSLYIILVSLLAIVVGVFGGGLLLVLISKLFKIEKPSYKKSLVVVLVSGIVGFIAGIIFNIINLGILSDILVLIVSFFAFHYFYKKYYQCSWKKTLGIYIVAGVIAYIVAFIVIIPIRLYVFSPYIVSGDAMNPTYANGTYLIINKLDKSFERGDVVVFPYPKDPSQTFIKRIIGLPQEKVEVKNGGVYINGQLLNEPYVNGATYGDVSLTLSSDQYFVLGDNRAKSFDSRMWGSLMGSSIQGKVSK